MAIMIPHNYKSVLSVRETQEAIKVIRDTFQYEMESELKLTRISAPLFVETQSGLNDNLNGVETPVNFSIDNTNIEIVHSLAKWKRMALAKYNFSVHEGLYTNMNAIRKDEDLDNLHSIYVDQWDWEKIIEKDERNFNTLKKEVDHIFKVIKHLEHDVWYKFPKAANKLPNEIHYISTKELDQNLSQKEQERKICKDKGCVFLSQISNHRAPDYDDWDLNGDILFWYEPLQCVLEISSMGIRVDKDSLTKQLKISNCEERAKLPYHKAVLNDELPFTIGGGIGQSRLCMLLLKKAHIGEVQASWWPQDIIDECEQNNISLL